LSANWSQKFEGQNTNQLKYFVRPVMDWDYLIKIARDENNAGNNMGVNPNSTRANTHHHGYHHNNMNNK